jgi:hypothetical protein
MCQISFCIQTLWEDFFTNSFAAYRFVFGTISHFPFAYPIALLQRFLLFALIYIAFAQYLGHLDTWAFGSLQESMRISLKEKINQFRPF